MSRGSGQSASLTEGASLQMLTLSVLQLCSRLMTRLEYITGYEAMLLELQIASMTEALARLQGQARHRQAVLELVLPTAVGSEEGEERPQTDKSNDVASMLHQLKARLAAASSQQRSSAARLENSLHILMQADYKQAGLLSDQDEKEVRTQPMQVQTTDGATAQQQPRPPSTRSTQQKMANLHAPVFFKTMTVKIGKKKIVKFLRS